jgi:predicted DNA-binding protein
MEQNTMKDQSKTKKTSKMVSFRMPMPYIDQLQGLADATGQSKSEVLRSGLDALQAIQMAKRGQTVSI